MRGQKYLIIFSYKRFVVMCCIVGNRIITDYYIMIILEIERLCERMAISLWFFPIKYMFAGSGKFIKFWFLLLLICCWKCCIKMKATYFLYIYFLHFVWVTKDLFWSSYRLTYLYILFILIMLIKLLGCHWYIACAK